MENTYRLDFNVDAWVQGLEIDASSAEEAKEKLYRMTLEEILEEGGIVKSSDVDDIDVKCICAQYDVKVSNIEYDIDEYEAEDVGRTVEEIVAVLPTELEVSIYWTEHDDVEDLIADEISDETGYLVKSYTYALLKK